MNISFRLLMILGKNRSLSKPQLINPENDTAVNVAKPWEMDSSAYADGATAYHTSTDWEIRSSTDTTQSNILYNSYGDTSNLTSINITLESPYQIQRPIYARVRYNAGTLVSEWSDFITIESEYCIPFSPETGYTPYKVSHSSWNSPTTGSSDTFQNNHAIWVEKNGQTDDILIGSIVSIYAKVTLSASDNNYTLNYSCDDDCQVIVYNEDQTKIYPIVNWNGTSNGISPGLHARGWINPEVVNFSLEAGTYTFVFNLYNDPTPGNTWSVNPGGSGFVITETTSGNVITDSANWASGGLVSAVFCSGGSLGSDGKCHCITSNMTTPYVYADSSPIYLDTSFNLLGSPYLDTNLTPQKATDWEVYTGTGQTGRALVNNLGNTTNLTSLPTNIPLANDITSPIYARIKYYGTDGNLSSSWSNETSIPLEYKEPFDPDTGYKIYRVTSTRWNDWRTGSTNGSTNTFQNNHAIWVGNSDSNDVLVGDILSIFVTVTFPDNGGNYSVSYSCDDSCQLSDSKGNVIINWNQAYPSNPNVPGLADVGFGTFTGIESGVNVNFSGSAGAQTFVINLYNDPTPGTDWSQNPGGAGFVFYDQPNAGGNILSDSANWASDSSIKLFFCRGAEIAQDQKCHCYSYDEANNVNNYVPPT